MHPSHGIVLGYFSRHFSNFIPQLYANPHAPCGVHSVVTTHGHPILIGACDLLLCPIWGLQVPPDTPGGAVFYPGEVDFTIQQPGDHWFWDKSHPYLNASQLFNTWLGSYGRGSALILNIPPDTTVQ